MRLNLKYALKYVRNCLVLLYISIIIWLEIVVYTRNANNWSPILCRNQLKCTRLLLVADPQLIGYKTEPAYYQFLSVWDSDRYISKTFSHAFQFSRPDLVLFLGDLMDEGSTASDEEFRSYLRRIFRLFVHPKAYERIRHIWMGGDNDLGGERFEPIDQHKVQRFDRAFHQPDVISVGDNDFYKISYLVNKVPKMAGKKDFFDTRRLTTIVSHLPLLYMPSVFNDKVLAKFQPQLIFAAHLHHAMIVNTNALTRDDRHVIRITPNNTHVYEYALGVSDMYEFLVPTCSYRMGTTDVGYGLAVIEDGIVRFTILWSPQRFPQLKIYAWMLFAFASWVTLYCLAKMINVGHNKHYNYI